MSIPSVKGLVDIDDDRLNGFRETIRRLRSEVEIFHGRCEEVKRQAS